MSEKECLDKECADIFNNRLIQCKAEVDAELVTTRAEISQLRTEVHELRVDVHGIREGVRGIEDSLRIIATSMSKLTDFPETWEKIKGFWAVVSWIKSNAIILVILLGIFSLLGYITLGKFLAG